MMHIYCILLQIGLQLHHEKLCGIKNNDAHFPSTQDENGITNRHLVWIKTSSDAYFIFTLFHGG